MDRLSTWWTGRGLLCVDGGLDRDTSPEMQEHPCILPTTCHVTLEIEYCHLMSGHSCKDFVLSCSGDNIGYLELDK